MKVIFYTCLAGAYDNTPAIPPDAELPCHLFADRELHATEAPGYRLHYLKVDMPCRRHSRMAKLRPFNYLPEHDISIYGDANLKWRMPIVERSLALLGDADLAVHRHPNTASVNVKQEFEKCCRLGLDHFQRMARQMTRYRNAGFPDHLPLTENCFLIRRDNETMRRFGELWWKEYCDGSQRDQLSFNYCLWKAEMEGYPVKVRIIEDNARDNALYRQMEHLQPRRVVA